MTTNLRYTYINNIKIGYNYPRNQFYVENKETTTYRTELQDIRNVLATLGITTEDISDSTLLFFKNNPETLEKVYYTWEDTGLYVKTLQFNDWKDYALIIDCNKAKIYIMNSTTIFNIDTNDSIPIVIAPILCSFYRDTLGLNIPLEKMISFCNFLISFYSPTCINTIEPKPEEAKHYLYSNVFKLTNYNNKAVSTYTCTGNPLNTFNNTPIAEIVALSDTTITLAEPLSQETIDTYNIQTGKEIVIRDISEDIEGTVYSADGTYTVQDIDNNLITIEETLPIEYSYPFYNCYAVVKEYTITEMSREDNSITLTSTPDSVLVGDTIIVKGTTITDNPYQTITMDSTYTVQSILNEESITNNLSYSTSSITQNSNNTITVTLPNSITIGNIGYNVVLNYTISYQETTTVNTSSTSTNRATSTTNETETATTTESTVLTRAIQSVINESIGSSIEENSISTKTNNYESTYSVISYSGNTITLQGTLKGINLSHAQVTEGNIAWETSSTSYKVIVEEQLETNFTGSATLIKNAFISSIKSIVTEGDISTLTFLNNTEYNLTGKYIMVYNSSIENFNTYQVQSMVQGEDNMYIGIKVRDIGIEPEPLSKLYYPVPSETINIDVTYSNNEATMPIGEFNVNSFQEAQDYLRLLRNNVVPSNEVGTNMYNKVADSMEITITVIGGEDYPYTIYFSGIYGDVYKEE